MWKNNWRDEIWSELDTKFDLIIIGGGITGAGILREAARTGYKTLLVEANDFASGTSSRSSKLVHGGLRYLKNLQFNTTLESVSERQNLLKHGEGLINQLEILFGSYKGDRTPSWQMGLGLILYGVMAGKWQFKSLDKNEILEQVPFINGNQLICGFPYYDAQTDDARLTLRVLQEAVQSGGLALNYAKAVSLLQNQQGIVQGIVVEDQSPNQFGRSAEVTADLVINASGIWADGLRASIGCEKKLRPLRGSHLVFNQNRLPLPLSVSINHPRDGRPVFAFPWEGVTIVGTTDVDVQGSIDKDPQISQPETEYLLDFVQTAFPPLELTFEDVISTWSGIRPVVNTGKANPSKESREHAIWYENGLLTITGGKLTTFRVMARDAMRIVQKHFPRKGAEDKQIPILAKPVNHIIKNNHNLHPKTVARLLGRYANHAPELISKATEDSAAYIGSTPYIWQELQWATQNEGMIHLDDLLLRRVRIGLLLPEGGIHLLPRIKSLIQTEIGWDDTRWEEEERAYKRLIASSYTLH